MDKSNKLIIGGFVFIVAVSAIVFLLMDYYMEKQTVSDVRQVARAYVEGIATEELHHFSSIADIRFGQMVYIKRWVENNSDINDADDVARVLALTAASRSLSTCALVDEDGNVETVYGFLFKGFNDPKFVFEKMKTGRMMITGGYNEKEAIVIWYAPAQYAMKSGRKSVGLICCRPMEMFTEQLHLDADGTLAFFNLIRRNGSYVFRGSDARGINLFDKMQSGATGLDKPIEVIIAEFKKAIDKSEPYAYETSYSDEEYGVVGNRSVLAMPLPDSNWYIVSIMPYNALDEIMKDMDEDRNKILMLAVAALFLSVFIVFILYYRMTRQQMNELKLATRRAEDAMAEAEFSSEEAIKAKDEADESRKRAEDALLEAEAANDEAIRAKEDAEYANKAKSEFLSNMSHDIRTPMNAIVGMTAIARDHMDDPARVEDCLRKITLSGKQLLGLINDVLDMAKIESGKMILNFEALSLRQTMETMCDIVRPQIQANHQNFDIFISNIISEDIYCDSIRLNQVLLNFLSNAMKFTPKDGSIHIDLWQEKSPKGYGYVRTHLSVKDTGMGMTEEFRKKLFTAFEREDNRRVHKIQGTGLGLTITKHIVDAMGGTIEVISAPGEGTTFHVTIDFERVRESESEMKLPPWKILVVDDSEELCRTVELELTELGAKPESCNDGETAVNMIVEAHKKGEDFFAALIDYKMIGMNGIETSKKIHSVLGDKSALPINLISAYDWTEIEDEARGAGISGFIAKPLFKSTLYHELRKYNSDNIADAPNTAVKEERINLNGMNILVAEDIDVNAEIAKMLLEESGAIVELAEDGQIASEMFAKSAVGHYDVILMDLRMPNMNGYEATVAIRSMKRADASTIPIIAMTADAFADDAQKCLEVGMNAHLAKPIDIDLLLKTLNKLQNG